MFQGAYSFEGAKIKHKAFWLEINSLRNLIKNLFSHKKWFFKPIEKYIYQHKAVFYLKQHLIEGNKDIYILWLHLTINIKKINTHYSKDESQMMTYKTPSKGEESLKLKLL